MVVTNRFVTNLDWFTILSKPPDRRNIQKASAAAFEENRLVRHFLVHWETSISSKNGVGWTGVGLFRT